MLNSSARAQSINKRATYRLTAGFLTPLLICTILTSDAHARVEDPGKQQLSISTRENPAYDPQGIRIGALILSPSVDNRLTYNDNVYARDTNRVEDFVYTVRPSINIDSDFIRHALNSGFYFERGIHRKTSGENYSDYGGHVRGRVDALADLSLPVDISYKQAHIRRGSPDERSAVEPSYYRLMEGSTGLINAGQKITTKILTTARRYLYDDTKGALGRIDNGDRNRKEYNAYASIGTTPDVVFAPFLYGNVKKIDYDRRFDNSGQNRDAMEYEGGVGTIINFSDVTSASLSVGRISRRSDDSSLSDIDDFTYSVNLKWEPSTLAAFTLSGERSISESVITGTSGDVTSSLRLGANYEMFTNLLLQPSVGLTDREFKGISGGRTLTSDAAIQFTYKMNQNFWFGGLYRYTKQDITERNPDLIEYEANTYSMNVTLQF